MTVVETGRFLRDAAGLISDSDRARLVEFIGAHPEAGDLLFSQRDSSRFPAHAIRKERKGEFEQGRAECDGEACACTRGRLFERERARNKMKKIPTVGKRIMEGLEEAIAWSKGNDVPVRVTQVQVPDVDVSKVRRQMGLSQTQFALKFGFPPATLRNWEQGRARPDTPTRVLLAVIAKHPESVEDVLNDLQRK